MDPGSIILKTFVSFPLFSISVGPLFFVTSTDLLPVGYYSLGLGPCTLTMEYSILKNVYTNTIPRLFTSLTRLNRSTQGLG